MYFSADAIYSIIGNLVLLAVLLIAKRQVKQGINHSTIKRVMDVVTVVAIATLVWTVISSTVFGKMKYRSEIESAISKNDGLDMFLYMKKYDRVNYDKFLTEIVDLSFGKNGSAEALAQVNKAGYSVMARYFQNTTDQNIEKYLRVYTNTLEYLAQNDPLAACALENGAIYGSLSKSALQIVKERGLNEALGEIIKEGTGILQSNNPEENAATLQNFAVRFEKNHPHEFELITATIRYVTMDEIRNLAKSYILFYEELLNQPKQDISKIYKGLRNLN